MFLNIEAALTYQSLPTTRGIATALGSADEDYFLQLTDNKAEAKAMAKRVKAIQGFK